MHARISGRRPIRSDNAPKNGVNVTTIMPDTMAQDSATPAGSFIVLIA